MLPTPPPARNPSPPVTRPLGHWLPGTYSPRAMTMTLAMTMAMTMTMGMAMVMVMVALREPTAALPHRRNDYSGARLPLYSPRGTP